MLKSNTADVMSDAPAVAAGGVKISSVVAKGNIRVSAQPRPKATPVATSDPAPKPAVQMVKPADPVAQPKHPAPTPELQLEPSRPEVDTPPSNLVRLTAAAAVLGVAAIGLAVLQLSGPSQAASEPGATAAPAGQAQTVAPAAKPQLQIAQANPSSAKSSSDLVAQMTAGTIAALRMAPAPTRASAPAATPAAAAPVQVNGLFPMVMAALQAGQSHEEIDQVVNAAYRNREIAVPAMLLTADDRVNTRALLTLLVNQ